MKLVLPSNEKGKRSYEIGVKKFGGFWMNSILGPVATKIKGKRTVNCLVHIPGFDSTKAKIIKGKPYDGRVK